MRGGFWSLILISSETIENVAIPLPLKYLVD